MPLRKNCLVDLLDWAEHYAGSKKELAFALDLPLDTIYKYRARLRAPSWQIFVRIAHAAGFVVTVNGIPAGADYWQRFFMALENESEFCRISGANNVSIRHWKAGGAVQMSALLRVCSKAEIDVNVVKVKR